MEPISNPEEKTNTAKKHILLKSVPKIYLIILALVVIAGLGYAGRYYYSKVFVKAQNDLGRMQAENYGLKYDVGVLQGFVATNSNQINDLTSRLDTYTSGNNQNYIVATPDLVIGTVTTFAPTGFPAGQKLLLIDFLAKNNTSKDIYFYSGYYKLKDNNNYQYQINDRGTAYFTLPDGRTQTDSLQLSPGEQTRGTLVYLLTRNDMTTLYLTDQNTGASIATLNYSAL